MFHELLRIVIETSVRIALVILPGLPLLGKRLRTVEVNDSTGGAEVARYLGRHGSKREAKAALIRAVPPTRVEFEKHPNGLPLETFNVQLKVYPGVPHGMRTNHAEQVNADPLTFLQS